MAAAGQHEQKRRFPDRLIACLRTLFSKEVTRPTFILVALFFFQNCTGFIATIFYSVDIFKVSLPFFRLRRQYTWRLEDLKER